MKAKKRLVVAERTKFLSMKQEIDKPIINTVYEMWVDTASF